MTVAARLSYAQNFEDLLLDRVFRNRAEGVYIDVGASDPVRYSVTLKFHLRGWRGVNVEPSPLLFAALAQARPGDVNLNVAAGAAAAEATLYHCDVPELSTLDAGVAAALRGAGRTFEELVVPVRTLAQISREHCGDRQVDFLKIDAEGWEAQVLAGTDFTRLRPRVLVVEAVRPNTSEPAYEGWEPALVACGFAFAYFDGLNRFYVRAEDRALLTHFKTPIGVFDGFSPHVLFGGGHAQAAADAEAALLRKRVVELEAEARRLRAQVDAERAAAVRTRQTWFQRKFASRLGILHHYPGRKLAVPAHYRQAGDAAALPGTDTLPQIAIVTPCLNGRAYLEETVASVLGQDYPQLHYVIQDGRSRDGSRELAERLAVAHRGRRTEVVSEHDDGQADAINRGFARTSAEIMAWLNADDLLLPGSLHYVARYLARHPEVDLVYGHRIVIDIDGREIGRWIVPPHMASAMGWADFVPQETLFWRRRVWEKVGPLDNSFAFAFDWDFILRAQRAGFRFKRLPRFLGAFRAHEQQKTHAMSSIGFAEMTRIRRAHFGRDVTAREIENGLRRYRAVHVLLHRAYKLKLVQY
jgi:FkbM family methyltransferase